MSASWYDRHVLPYLLDFLCSLEPVRRQREKIVPRAEGRVLEIGIGTGLNVRHDDKTKVGKITCSASTAARRTKACVAGKIG